MRVVLMGGCDKTVLAQLMGAGCHRRPATCCRRPMMTAATRASARGLHGLPAVLGALARRRVDKEEISTVPRSACRHRRTCAVMGTASTHGLHRGGASAYLARHGRDPAVHADRLARRRSDRYCRGPLIGSTLTPDRLVNAKSSRKRAAVLLALGGSTNAIIHLTASRAAPA